MFIVDTEDAESVLLRHKPPTHPLGQGVEGVNSLDHLAYDTPRYVNGAFLVASNPTPLCWTCCLQ